MFEGKRFRRGCLTLIAVALVTAMLGAFGLASMSATAEPANDPVTSDSTATITVTGLETGVIGKAYRYMTLKWKDEGDVHQPVEPVYVFDDQVATWIQNSNNSSFKQYIGKNNAPTDTFRKLLHSDMRDFSDALLAAIAEGTVQLTEAGRGEEKSVAERAGEATEADESAGSSLVFTLQMGGYLIRLSNGSTCVYQPIASFIKPEWTNEGYKLKAETVNGAPGNNVEAKSKKITSTKTVTSKDEPDKIKTKAHSQIGDELNFMIKTPVPNYPQRTFNKKFGVKDQAQSGLTIKTSSIKVRISDGEMLNSGSDYSVKTFDPDGGNKGQGFTIEFNSEQYEDKLTNAGEDGQELIIEYEGELNEKAPVKGGVENWAQALILKDNYDREGEYTEVGGRPSVTTVYTYGVELTKVDAEKETKKLKDAQFKLQWKPYKNPLHNGQRTEVKVKKKSDGIYIVDPKEGTPILTSGSNGQVRIDGLGATGVYELVETKAPPGGYALPNNKPTTIDIRDEKKIGKDDSITNEPDGIPDDTSAVGGWFIVKPDEHNRLTFNITNKKADFRLPRTGAIGAVIFGVFGVVLIAVSVAVVAAHRRKARR
ncbi:isopeptide-forming domain-containing fimbrial protein [Bifidobacterium panos]|uniref:Gram-positive pilin backbone subunit 2, Cna-B-like domain-containing protein n=1 Tax=Bifidobacterium panos TaxID=2675321 RepID=A0ABX1SVZ0_9BIFI|nr:isopeptide-forming domain-containing fimbrial protein [Bifidobacterium sp. DSM 109963]NMN02001.1 Gram-positive pilin backbone subunit 2, Cna-B-like domain-containing protein [Bifidobacterium sp. DSM 109963]